MFLTILSEIKVLAMEDLGRPLKKVRSAGFAVGKCFSELEIRVDEDPSCSGLLSQRL